MSKYRPGDEVTVQPPYDSPQMAAGPSVHIAKVGQYPDGTRYIVTSPHMVRVGQHGKPILDDDGTPVLMTFGPYREHQLAPGWDGQRKRLR